MRVQWLSIIKKWKAAGRREEGPQPHRRRTQGRYDLTSSYTHLKPRRIKKVYSSCLLMALLWHAPTLRILKLTLSDGTFWAPAWQKWDLSAASRPVYVGRKPDREAVTMPAYRNTRVCGGYAVPNVDLVEPAEAENWWAEGDKEMRQRGGRCWRLW